MKIPFVSRERFDEMAMRAVRLEEENRALRNELTAIKISAASKSALPPDADMSWQPIPGKATIATIVAQANAAGELAVRTPGAKGPSREIEERRKELQGKMNVH